MTTPEKSVDIICQCRKGSMDDKQFRATVQHNIDLLLQAERQKRDELEVAIMAEAHHHAIDDGTQYPKITLHRLATILGGSYHARLEAIKEAAREDERQKREKMVEEILKMTVDEQMVYDTLNQEQKRCFHLNIRKGVEEAVKLERQKREEVVEKLGKELFQKTLADMKMSDDLRVAFLKAFIQLNYPHYRDWFTQTNNQK